MLAQVGDQRADDQAVPPRVVAIVDRRGAQQRAEADPDAAQRGLAGGPLRAAGAVKTEAISAIDQGEQPDRRFEERELRPVEVEADVAGGQRAGQQGGQERAEPCRGGEAEPLEDVESELHRYRASGP